MKKIKDNIGKVIASMALVMATMTANVTCAHHLYQDEVPEDVKKLSKVK